MILVVDFDLKNIKITAFRPERGEFSPSFFIKDPDEIKNDADLKKFISTITAKEALRAISFRILFGGDYFSKPHNLDQGFFAKFVKLTDFFPFYVPGVMKMLKSFYRNFPGIPKIVFFESAFFSRLPEEEKYYAIPREIQQRCKIRKWGFHGLFHEANAGIFPGGKKCISIVLDKPATVCAVSSGRARSISLGVTPLDGVMSRTSCGDLDPGIVFYLMNVHKFSVYAIDDILKNKSGFLGLTGYDLEIKDLIKLYGKDAKVDLAFQVYQAQLLKYIGEGISLLGGLDIIIFAGSQVDALLPLIHSLIKKISFLEINTVKLPWAQDKKISAITSADSKIRVYLNRLSVAETIFCATERILEERL